MELNSHNAPGRMHEWMVSVSRPSLNTLTAGSGQSLAGHTTEWSDNEYDDDNDDALPWQPARQRLL